MDRIINKGDKVYYARIMPTCGIYDVYELTARSVQETYFVGIEKRDKRSFLFSYDQIGKSVFLKRRDALNKTLEAEKDKKDISTETFYEEY